MNKRLAAAGIAMLLLAGCGIAEPNADTSILDLPPCTSDDTAFAKLNVDASVEAYHGAVTTVIDAHVNELENIAARPLQCTAGDYRTLLKPSKALADLALTLPEWGPDRALELSEADMASVLLEHLRVYECSLYQRREFLAGVIARETSGQLTTSDLLREETRQRSLINRELETARPALERTLAFLGGIDRLRPLAAELECLKRASLDLRNVTGLTAEAVSCMPKIWDARGSLRDIR